MTVHGATAPPLRLGTRRSKLAMIQARWVAGALTAHHPGRPVGIAPMTSAGDRSTAPIQAFGDTGVFVTALRDALLRGEVDFLVHSFKDLPTVPDPRLVVAAVPVREDPRDALVWGVEPPDRVPAGARIGSGAPRRAVQLRAAAPGVEVVPVRGNVDSRLALVERGELDAVVLAMAGLTRLHLAPAGVVPLPVDRFVPAPAQGALAVECRADDPTTIALLSALDDPPSRVRVTAEREVLRTLDAGCTAPVGAYATLSEMDGRRTVHVKGIAASHDGSTVLRSHASGPPDQAATVGRQVGRALLAMGAGELVRADGEVQDPRTPPRTPPRR